MLVHAYVTSPGKPKWNGPHHTIKMLPHFVFFHSVTCYTNSIVSRTHANTTKLRNITCALVATRCDTTEFRVYLVITEQEFWLVNCHVERMPNSKEAHGVTYPWGARSQPNWHLKYNIPIYLTYQGLSLHLGISSQVYILNGSLGKHHWACARIIIIVTLDRMILESSSKEIPRLVT